MLDGATPAPLVLLLFQLIARSEFFCLFRVDENFLKLYSWNIVHTTSPYKYVIVIFLFYHCLIVEVSQSF